MDKEEAIKKISDKFGIKVEDITSLLERKNTPQPREPKKTIQKPLKAKKKSDVAPKKKYFFLKRDYLLLLKKIDNVKIEVDRLGHEIGASCDDSETFHDNFDYEECGRQQTMWIRHLKNLEKIKDNVEIISDINSQPGEKSVKIGSEVQMSAKNGEVTIKKIGSYLTFIDTEISYRSPLAKLIIGKKINDEIIGIINGTESSFTIINIK